MVDMIKEINANKTNLNRVIKWSSSRFNYYNKSEVVEDILRLIEERKIIKKEYGTGSFSESGHLGGRTYILKITKNDITLTEKYSNIKNIYKLKVK